MQTKLIFSQEDSHVNHTPKPGSDLAKQMTDISGRKCLEQLEKLNQVGLWAKMFTALLIGMEGWYSTRCKLTWKLKGTKYGRFYCQLAVSTHLTNDFEFGLLPTVTAMDSTNATATMKSTQVKEGSMHTVTLARAMTMGMLPTPNARDHKDPQHPEKYQVRKMKWAEKGINLQLGLPQYIQNQMLPTPMASDCGDKVTGLENQNSLVKITREMTGKPSQLSPQFVMEMMGFPTDWTLLPFLNGETNQSKPEEMP